MLENLKNMPREPFEKGGFLTGRPFIDTVFKDKRARAVGNIVYTRPLDETFHLFLLRRFSETLTQQWVEAEEAKETPHTLIQWYREMQRLITETEPTEKSGKLRSVELTGNMRSLLVLSYDFYSLQHCGATVLPKLLERLRDENQFQGARYEIAVAGLVCRAGFEIKWIGGKNKHCEFSGKHKVTGDEAIFEAKSHHRAGVLGKEGSFDSQNARIKIMDHIREALEQAPDNDLPLVIFDDLNLPLAAGTTQMEKESFKSVEEQLKKYGFLDDNKYRRCGALIVTNFSWHFHYDVPPQANELVTHFHVNGKYSLKTDTVLQYLDQAAKQYGHVPHRLHEFESK